MSAAVLQSSCHDLNDNFCKLGHNYSNSYNMKNSLKNISEYVVGQKKYANVNTSSSTSVAITSNNNPPLRRANSGTSCSTLFGQSSNLTVALTASVVQGMNSHNNNKLTNQSLLAINDTSNLFPAKQQTAQQQQQQQQQQQLLLAHRKLDRSMSEPVERGSGLSPAALLQQQQQARQLAINGGNGGGNSSRYKTELCRPYEESGSCKYGDKCQFAHGVEEVRTLARHPKYKTELCRTFHTTGLCPYGPRCHFIHEHTPRSSSSLSGDGGAPASSGGRDIVRHDDGMGSTGNSPHHSDSEGGGSPPDSGLFYDDSAFHSMSSYSTPATPTATTNGNNAPANFFPFNSFEFGGQLRSPTARYQQQQKSEAFGEHFLLRRQHSLGAQTVYSGLKQQLLPLESSRDSCGSAFRDARAVSPPEVVLPPIAASDVGSDALSAPLPGSPTGFKEKEGQGLAGLQIFHDLRAGLV